MTAVHRFYSYFFRATLLIAVSALIFFAAIFPSFASTEDSGIDIKISLNQKEYLTGESVTISVSVTNNTGKALSDISIRPFVPDCFDITGASKTYIETLEPRQTFKTQIYATANTDVKEAEILIEEESDSTQTYIIIGALSALVFISLLVIFKISENKRKKVAGTISFVFALVFSLAVIVIPSSEVFANSSDIILTDNISYEEASDIVKLLYPDKYPEIKEYISKNSPLTREKAAVISALMISGRSPLPEESSKTFIDVSDDAFSKPYIELCISEKIMSEISSGTFLPDEEMNGYEFLECLMRAIGLGANNEYDSYDKLAFVTTDVLNLPHTDLSYLITDKTLTCREALSAAVKLMMNSSAAYSERGTYDFSAPSLISYFEGITENKAIFTDTGYVFLAEDGRKIEIKKSKLAGDFYTAIYFNGEAVALTPDRFTQSKDVISLIAGGKNVFLGASAEYSHRPIKTAYSALTGRLHSENEIFTSDNLHYVASPSSFNETVYIIDSDMTERENIDFTKQLVFIASFDSRSLTYSINKIAFTYQQSTAEKANYDSYNATLASAKSISNGNKTYLQSAFDSFYAKINEIDSLLKKDLIDTKYNRKAISVSENAIENAVKELENNKIVSYTALDEQINIAKKLMTSEGEYTEESFAFLKDSYTAAISIPRELLDTAKNRATVDFWESRLADAMGALELSKYCNYTKYYAALASAKAVSNDTGKYPASLFSSFQKKIKNIDNGLKKNLERNESNQAKIDKACESLLKAISDLNYNIPCDYTKLDAAIEVALTYENPDFRWTAQTFSALQDALKAAQNVERNMKVGYGTTNQDTIDAAATYLTASIKNLKKNKLCDYSEYNKALSEANAITNVEELYADEIYRFFKETLEAIDAELPKNLYRADETNALIANAVSAIARAIELLKEPANCDYAELDKAVELAEEVLKNGKEYTSESLKALTDALDIAKAIERELLADALDKRQSMINKAAEDINNAIEALAEQETFDTEIVLITVKTVTVNKEKIEQTYITVIRADKEEKYLLPDSLEYAPVKGDKITVSVSDGTVYAVKVISSPDDEHGDTDNSDNSDTSDNVQ